MYGLCIWPGGVKTSGYYTQMTPDRLLCTWAQFAHAHAEGLGYSSTTTLGRAAAGELVFGQPCGARLPVGVQLPGLREYHAVERVLDQLGQGHRLVVALEYGLLRPEGVPIKGQARRAALMGVSRATYTTRLRAVRDRLGRFAGVGLL